MKANNYTSFFTEEEKKTFFYKFRELSKALSESLEKDDFPKIRQLLKPVVAMECYGRDRNGING